MLVDILPTRFEPRRSRQSSFGASAVFAALRRAKAQNEDWRRARWVVAEASPRAEARSAAKAGQLVPSLGGLDCGKALSGGFGCGVQVLAPGGFSLGGEVNNFSENSVGASPCLPHPFW